MKTVCLVLAALVIALHWVNTRVAIVRTNQFDTRPVLPTSYALYHSMATGLSEGRIGQIDLTAVNRHTALNDPWAPFERSSANAPPNWVSFYTLDIGYSFIVEAARLMFRALPDNHLRALALQLLVDAALVGFVYFAFAQWSSAIGLLAAFLYSSNQVFFDLVSFPFYYYWDIPLTFLVFGSLVLAHRRPGETAAWLALAASVVGFGVWLRGSWWPIGLFLLIVAMCTRRFRKHVVIPAVLFSVIAAPQVARASYARGHLALSTRTSWHVALVGLGYYPNPYGLEAKDQVIFKLTKDKYGVDLRTEDYWSHDQAARQEYLAIWRRDPGFVIRSFLGRLSESVAGRTETSVRAFQPITNIQYVLLCLVGLVAMIARGGDKRMLGIAAAGTYVIYVVLTSVFYFVGLAYDNVSQVTLFVLCMGAADCALSLARRGLERLRASAAVGAVVDTSVPSRA